MEDMKTRSWMRGSIILLHDGGGDRQATIDALPQLIDALRADGVRHPVFRQVVLDADVDTTCPSGELMATVVAAFAQYERRLIAARTSDAMQAMKSRGVRLGRPVDLPDDVRNRIAAERAAPMVRSPSAQSLRADRNLSARHGRVNRAVQIAHQILFVFDPDRDTHQVRGHFALRHHLRRNTRVRHAPRHADR